MRVPPAEPSGGRRPVVGGCPLGQELRPAPFPPAVGPEPATPLTTCPHCLEVEEQSSDLSASLGLGLLGQEDSGSLEDVEVAALDLGLGPDGLDRSDQPSATIQHDRPRHTHDCVREGQPRHGRLTASKDPGRYPLERPTNQHPSTSGEANAIHDQDLPGHVDLCWLGQGLIPEWLKPALEGAWHHRKVGGHLPKRLDT